MHQQHPPLAHRDIKPHNVLLKPITSNLQQERPRHEYSSLGQEEPSPAPSSLFEDNGYSFHAVLMDFGSTRHARVEINNRMEALRMQEDAEVS